MGALIRAFQRWHGQRHESTTLTRDYYSNDEFEQELVSLLTEYGSSRNRLMLTYDGGHPADCIALRELDNKTCEMKRMFVLEAYQGKGIGRALTKQLITAAKNMKYKVMKLNTSIRQTEAQKLYESLDFKRTAPYYTLPKRLEEWLVFTELKL